MTTIVYRKGVIAADTRIMSGDWLSPYRGRKILQLADGGLIGLSGDPTRLDEFKRYVEGPGYEPLDLADEATGIWITPYGDVSIYSGKSSRRVLGPFAVIGSGTPAALAALHMGADARRAVEIAMLVDPCTGGEIETLELLP